MLTKKNIQFADEYMSNGYNARQAYLKVYNNQTNKDPSYPYDLLRKEEIKEYIQKKREEVFNTLCIDHMRICEAIASIAFGPISC